MWLQQLLQESGLSGTRTPSTDLHGEAGQGQERRRLADYLRAALHPVLVLVLVGQLQRRRTDSDGQLVKDQQLKVSGREQISGFSRRPWSIMRCNMMVHDGA